MDKVIVFWFGLTLGSFLNVLVYRLPKEESIVRPRSRCPRCRKPIAFYDNIPVLSYLLLRGRCRHCAAKISWRYPAVELLMGLVALALWARWSAAPAWAGACVVAATLLVAVTAIDWQTFLIPDELSLGLLAIGGLVSPLNPYLADPRAPWWRAVLLSARGAALGFFMCFAVAYIGEKLFKKEAMGGGDVKLLAAIGAWFGATGAFDSLMLGSLLGSLYGVALMARGKARRYDPIPFGPFLSAGALFNFFVLLPLGFPFVTR